RSATVPHAPRRAGHGGSFHRRSCGIADVAQLVAHHLAKVRVAGSSPVVRSARPLGSGPDSRGYAREYGGVAEWLRQGPAKPCTRVRFPPPPRRAISSVGEHYLDTVGVTGSIPVSATHEPPRFWGVQSFPGTSRAVLGPHERWLALASVGSGVAPMRPEWEP